MQKNKLDKKPTIASGGDIDNKQYYCNSAVRKRQLKNAFLLQKKRLFELKKEIFKIASQAEKDADNVDISPKTILENYLKGLASLKKVIKESANDF